MTTLAPSLASLSTVARPKPEAPPVTSAIDSYIIDNNYIIFQLTLIYKHVKTKKPKINVKDFNNSVQSLYE